MPRWAVALLVLAACLVTLGYALFTGHIWEDSFITLRHSENLLQGEGLVYNPGERVHGFTSPINVLLLAAAHLVTGQSSYDATFWAYRVACIAAFAAGGVLLVKRIWDAFPGDANPAWFAAFLYLFSLKSVAFTTNGMETAFVLLFLAGTVYLLVRDEPGRWLARGLCWAGLMWTRPDGCVYIAALGLADAIFSPSPKRQLLPSLAKSAVVCAVVYGPWFAWAWTYYGSPVPHTVVAKSLVETGALGQFLGYMDNLLFYFLNHQGEMFRPIYAGLGDGNYFAGRLGSWPLNGLTRAAGIFCTAYWLLPVNDRLGRAASLSFAIVGVYFAFMMMPSPWYLPPEELLGMVTLTCGIVTLSAAACRRWYPRAGGRIRSLPAAVLFVVLAAGQVALFGLNAWQMKIQQAEVEMGNRAVVGNWLRDHGQSTDSVYLEPLGYIGYFSRMRMVDWPGLVAPQVVKLRGERFDRYSIMLELMPDWVVLRRGEINQLHAAGLRADFERNYVLAEQFDVTQALDSYRFLPGKPYVYSDAVFAVFRRKSTP
ncbi:MAG: hypothetical protein HYX69_03790 [Planctomycetia bacterium]|nr:hypothetical protein [Planctomycetia bacterium]